MKAVQCQNCGSTDLKKENGYWVCQYCGTKNYFTEDEKPAKESDIVLDEDVKRLLDKWDSDPANADKYAKLILQIDPNNARAKAKFDKKSQGGCYVATAVYGSYDCPEVWTLRRYRDYVLAESVFGRLIIRLYYSVSPVAVKLFGNRKWFKGLLKPALDRFVMKLNESGIDDSAYQDRNWE